MAKGVRIDTSQVRNNLNTYKQHVYRRAFTGIQIVTAQNENRAKSTAKWTDRTGQARSSITGSFETDGNSMISALAIGADHGIFLEKANGGNYAIVWPTILEQQRQLIEIGRVALVSGAA